MYKLSKKSILPISFFLLIIGFSFYIFFNFSKSKNLDNNFTKDITLSQKLETEAEFEKVSTTSVMILEKDASSTKSILQATTSVKLVTKKIIPVATPKNNTSSINNSTTTQVLTPVIPAKKTVTEVIKPSVSSCLEDGGGFGGQIENEINNVRASYGLTRLVSCKELRNSSYQKYLDIVAQNNFTHDWAGGKKLYDVIVNSGYVPKKWGEILEYGSDFTTAKEHVDNWMSSSAHKSIILTPEYTHFGVYVGGWNVEGIAVDMGIAHFGKK